MYQFIGEISDTKVGGLDSLLNYMNEHSFSKDGLAINEHRYHIIKSQYTAETHGIYNVEPSITFNIKGNTYIYLQMDNISIKNKM